MNSTENAMFENSMSNSATQAQDASQVQSPERTSTPVSNSESNDQNHCINEQRTSPTPTSPGREKSPTWEQQQSNTTDNDTVDSEVSTSYSNVVYILLECVCIYLYIDACCKM